MGYVLATDWSPLMMVIARERAVALGLHHMEFKGMDMEDLDLPEESFHAVLCRR